MEINKEIIRQMNIRMAKIEQDNIKIRREEVQGKVLLESRE